MISDTEIEQLAEEYARAQVPDPSRVLSISKWDLKAGFIAGAKAMLEKLENKQGPKGKNRFDY